MGSVCAVLALLLGYSKDARADGPIRWSDHSRFDFLPINLTHHVEGMQLGFWNVADRLDGFQLAYGCTQIARQLNGVQLGLMSNWSDNARGVQIGGFLNVAGNLKGLQIGLINATTDSSGLSLGLINWVSNGRMMFEGMGSSLGYADAGFRSGNRWNQYTYIVGTNLAHRGVRVGGGFGGHVALPWGSLDLDAFAFLVGGGSDVKDAESGKTRFSKTGAQGELRLSTSFQISRSASIVVAGSLNVFSGGTSGLYLDYGMGKGSSEASVLPGLSLGVRLGRDRYPTRPATEEKESDPDALHWGDNPRVLTPLQLQGSYRGRQLTLYLEERDGWTQGAYSRGDGLLMLRWQAGALVGFYSEQTPAGARVVGEAELHPEFRDDVLYLNGKLRASGATAWDENFDTYSVVASLPALEQRTTHGRFDFAPPLDPAPASTPAGAAFVSVAPTLFACLYGQSQAKFHDVLVTKVEALADTSTKVEAFVRGQYPNGWQAEVEVTVTIDGASGKRQFTLGRSNIPDPASSGCTLPDVTLPNVTPTDPPAQ